MHCPPPPGLFPIPLKVTLKSTPPPPPSPSHFTDHLLNLGHPTPFTKSATTVVIVTRCMGASRHGVSPSSSHPSRATGCAHCCVTELLRLKWGGEETDTEQQQYQRTAPVHTHTSWHLTSHPLPSPSPPTPLPPHPLPSHSPTPPFPLPSPQVPCSAVAGESAPRGPCGR